MRASEASSAPDLASGGILGRDAELARLVSLLESDTPVVIRGEAGVGKTTLARTAIRSSGRRSFEGGGFGTLAWAPFLALERALGRGFAGADLAYVAQATARLVGEGLLFVDDLQWVDAGSRAVIRELAGRIGLVLGVRDGDPATNDVIAELEDLEPQVATIELAPLDEELAIELAQRVGIGLSAAAARRVARQAGGNPLLVTELASGRGDTVTLGATVRLRLGGLGPAARDAMSMLAVAGHPLAISDLGPGAGPLASSGLALVDGGGRLRVRHELIAAAAAEALTEVEIRALHGRLARLAQDPGAAARHHLAADESELAHVRALAAAAAATTPGERASHLEIAALSARGPESVELRIRAAAALIDGSYAPRALALLADLDDVANPRVSLERARAHRLEYDLPAARRALERGLAAVTPGDEAMRVELHVEAARILAGEMGDKAQIVAAATAAEAAARRLGVATTAACALLGEARILAGDLGGIDDLSAAQAAAEADGDDGVAMEIGDELIFALLKAGRQAEGRALAERLAGRAAELRLASWADEMRLMAAAFAWHGGDSLAVIALMDRLRDEQALQSDTSWYELQSLADVGRLDEARLRMERWLDRAGPGEHGIGVVLWGCADIALLGGRWADTIAYADRHAREVPNAHHRMFIEVAAAWATVELGRPATWPSLANGMPVDEGGSIELEALRAYATDDLDAAVDGFDRAAAAWAGRHARGERRTRWAAAESLRRLGRVDAARERLLALEAELEAAGEVPLRARVHRSLRLLGERRAARHITTPGSPLSGREREILDLSASGVRDAQIAARLGISRWAVVRAAESALAKLGAASRAEAVATLTRR